MNLLKPASSAPSYLPSTSGRQHLSSDRCIRPALLRSFGGMSRTSAVCVPFLGSNILVSLEMFVDNADVWSGLKWFQVEVSADKPCLPSAAPKQAPCFCLIFVSHILCTWQFDPVRLLLSRVTHHETQRWHHVTSENKTKNFGISGEISNSLNEIEERLNEQTYSSMTECTPCIGFRQSL